jgi:large subunit ribosomal protein L19
MNYKKLIFSIQEKNLNKELPLILVGDTIRIGVRIQEGNKQRIQPFEGTVIARHFSNTTTTITVRKIFQGIGVERVFPIYSPIVQDIKILKRAKIRRSKLYYLRNRIGKATRLKENYNIIKN